MTFSNSHSHHALERLDHVRAFHDHCQNFNNIRQSLHSLYGNYKNGEKIIHLLDAWLYFYRGLYEAYGFNGLDVFEKSDFKCPVRFSYFYEYGFNISNVLRPLKNKFLFTISNSFLTEALLPGAKVKSISSKLRWRFAKFIILTIPVQKSDTLKSQIVDLSMRYFEGYFSDSESEDIKRFISNCLPSVFYESEVKVISKNILDVECCPWAFLDFSGFERIFLLSRTVKVLGLQHGGGYFAFDPKYGAYGGEFEEKISDHYIGWGLSPKNNARQHRYPLRKERHYGKKRLKRLIWVEHSRLPIFCYFIWPCQIRQTYNLDIIKYISKETNGINVPFYSRPYPNDMKSEQYQGYRVSELQESTALGENAIKRGDILIFDDIGSSLIYHCVEQEIPFILVVSTDDVVTFSKSQMEWFDVIRNAELAFYVHEVGMLRKKISEVFKINYELPQILRDFHRDKFIDI